MAFSPLNLNFSSESITATTSISIFPKNTACFLFHKPSLQNFSPQKFMQTINLKNTNVGIRCSLQHCRPIYTPGRISDKNYVRVFDTTLREGEQAPGAGMTVAEKLSIARKLADLRVDIIEAGFPASSKDNFEATELIAKKVGNAVNENDFVPVITACGRCVRKDINMAWDAIKHAKHPRVVVFIATTEIHMMYESKKTKAEVLKMAAEMVAYARSLCDDVGFVCENDGRSDKEFLYQVYGEAIKSGASTITFTDTVGYNFPNEIENFIGDMKANVPGIDNAVIGIHCHNDLGLATANALAGVYAGARQVDVTVNGIGERAGNTPLEEFVMAIKCRGRDELGGLHTGIDTKHIITASMMVEEYTGHPLQPHKAIVGANVFSGANGIHQDGTLKHKRTFQIIYPEDIGLSQSDCQSIVLQKLSGRHASTYRLTEKPLELHSQAWQEFQLLRRLLSLFNKNRKPGPGIDDLLQKLKAAVGPKKMLKAFRMMKRSFGKFLISSTSTKR